MANRNIGTLSIDLIAKTFGFKEGMTAAERQLDKVKRSANAFGKELAAMGTRFAAVSASIGAFVGVGLRLGDELKDSADALGLTTEALAGLRNAARITGVETSQLDSALVSMTKSVSEAAQGTGRAQKAFEQLGLDAKELNRLSPDEQFEAIAAAMEEVGVQGDKVALVMKIFRDAELVRTLALGEKGLNDSADAAEKFGTALSGVQADEIDAANIAIDNMRTAVEGLAIQMAAKFAPAVISAATSIANFIASLNTALEAFRFMDAAIFGFEQDVRSLSFNEIGANIELVQDQIKDLNEQIKETKRLAPITGGQADTSYLMQIEKLNKDLAEANKRLEELNKRKEQFAEAEGEQLVEIKVDVDPGRLQKLREELDKLFDQKVQAYNNSLDAFASRFSTAKQRAEALREELERFRPDLNADAIRNAEAAITEELTGGLEEITVNIRRRVTEPYKKAVDEMTQYTIQAKRNMQDALADFLFDPFEDGLKGMLKSFVDTLRQMAANMAAAQIFELFGTGGSANNFLRDLFGFGRAAGGPVAAGTAYVVGERGPELFMPNVNGTIIPNGSSQQQQAVYITQNNHIEGSNLGPEQMVTILNENNKKLKGEFLQELRRGTYS